MSDPRVEIVQCVCGKQKQRGFICDFCYSTEDASVDRIGIESTETRALIDNRTPAETAEAKAWSDDAHARIQAGEVSGSHDLMRAKVGEYRAGTQEGT